jgi:Tfp pilus assembly protein PilF/ketosteroid isomerase-like protein
MTRLLLLALLLSAVSMAQAQRVPVTTDSETARDHYALAMSRVSHVDFDAARVHLDAAIEADPEFALAHIYRAWLSPPSSGEEHLRQAQAVRASDAERQMVEAYAAHHSGDHDREIEIMADLYEQHPDDGDAATWLGNELYFNDRYDEATDVLRRAIAADPSNASAINMLGYTLMESGDTEGAERAFLDYIRVAPEEGNPYDSYGEFLLGEGRLDEAEVQFHKALARDPELTASENHLVRIAMERSDLRLEGAIADGDADAAVAAYAENAVVMAPDMPRVRGHDAIRDLFAGMIASGVDGADIQTVNVLHFDDWAVRESNVVLSAGGQVADRLKALELWRQVDGEWLYVRDMFSSDGDNTTAAN